MKTATFLNATVLAAGLSFANIASAQEPAPSAHFDIEELSLEEMAMLAGGDGEETVIVITDQTLTATNHNNSVIGDVIGSGDVTLGTNAFSGYSGLGNFVINTGHNNNLQASMNVSVVLPPGSPG